MPLFCLYFFYVLSSQESGFATSFKEIFFFNVTLSNCKNECLNSLKLFALKCFKIICQTKLDNNSLDKTLKVFWLISTLLTYNSFKCVALRNPLYLWPLACIFQKLFLKRKKNIIQPWLIIGIFRHFLISLISREKLFFPF